MFQLGAAVRAEGGVSGGRLVQSPRMLASRSVDAVDRARVERDVRALCEGGQQDAAASLAVRSYGPELLSFLLGTHPSRGDAGDCFSEVCEIVWRKLPEFTWDHTLRTWAYAIARNVSRTHARNARRRKHREAPAADSAIEAVAQAVRTGTLPFLRTEKRDRLRALRDELPEEDRVLLVLRVDRGLEWIDIARVLAGDDALLDDALLKREAARLRKRFQIVKERLREMAKRAGLVG
jgi:RNA polymerase sigma-70 factor (ECF subfamily)